MKTQFFILTLMLFMLASGFQCSKQVSDIDQSNTNTRSEDQCFKGKLVIKGICMNYTISVQSGTIDKSLIEQSWTDKSTGKVYQNVFALGSQCTFPADIKEGDEFYFKIVGKNDENCAVCMAYYPTPSKKLAIAVLTSKCGVE